MDRRVVEQSRDAVPSMISVLYRILYPQTIKNLTLLARREFSMDEREQLFLLLVRDHQLATLAHVTGRTRLPRGLSIQARDAPILL